MWQGHALAGSHVMPSRQPSKGAGSYPACLVPILLCAVAVCCVLVCRQSADYDPHHPGTVRRDGSFIYEEFLTTGGTDVKVYTVGPR